MTGDTFANLNDGQQTCKNIGRHVRLPQPRFAHELIELYKMFDKLGLDNQGAFLMGYFKYSLHR